MIEIEVIPALNARQRKFAELVARGDMPVHKCYMECYACDSEKAARASSNRLISKAQVANYIRELQAKSETEAVMSLETKRRLLAEIVNTPAEAVTPSSRLCQAFAVNTASGQVSVKMLDKMKALDMDNRLAGHYEDSIRIDGDSPLVNFIARIREDASA
jgi:hypothetical protein